MNSDDAFSSDYRTARARFRRLSKKVTDNIRAYPVCSAAEDLTIDVAIVNGAKANNKLVISSGLHGVEGFVGSAIQIALLQGLINREIDLTRWSLVLIHAMNPFGFEYIRRVNENNVDLNRNFLVDFNHTPSSTDYARFSSLLNPRGLTRGPDVFTVKACLYICRFGMSSLRNSIAAGQYDFPRGLFFGGHSATQSAGLIREILLAFRSERETVIHIDVHSGLGAYADYRLLLSGNNDYEKSDLCTSLFDTAKIESIGEKGGITGSISGTISEYFNAVMGKKYHHVGLEFGTYSNLRLLRIMRLENAAHHYLDDADARNKKIKSEFLECFCPADPCWRSQVIGHGLKVIGQVMMAGR